MSELSITPLPSREELRQGLRDQAGEFDPPLRVLAEQVLAEASAIDLVTADATGRVVLLLIGDAGEDLQLFTRALAHREWVQARLGDWAQLAPGLDLRVDATVRVILLCPSFQPETLSASSSSPGRDIDLAILRCVRNGHHLSVLIELLEVERRDAMAAPAGSDRRSSLFRSGLTEKQLNLSSEELEEFD